MSRSLRSTARDARSRRVLCLVAVMLAAACRSQEPVASTNEPDAGAAQSNVSSGWDDPYTACDQAAAVEECVAGVEATLLTATPSALRSSDTLAISGSDGAVLRLIDGEGGAPLAFRYLGYAEEIRQHVVRVSRFEGSDHVLVDARTTNQTHVLGYPILSPDGTRFASVSMDLVAGHNPNGIQIWRAEPDRLVLEWDLRGGSSWGPAEVRWDSGSTVRFIRVVAGPQPREIETVLTVAADSLGVAPTSPS